MKVFTQTRTFLEGVGETGSYEATASPEILILLFHLLFGGTVSMPPFRAHSKIRKPKETSAFSHLRNGQTGSLPHIFLSSPEALLPQPSPCPAPEAPREWGLSPSYYSDGLGKYLSACCHQSKRPMIQEENSEWGMGVRVVTTENRKNALNMHWSTRTRNDTSNLNFGR